MKWGSGLPSTNVAGPSVLFHFNSGRTNIAIFFFPSVFDAHLHVM